MPETVVRPSDPAVRRLLRYSRYLDSINSVEKATVSSSELARVVGATASQVRHDFLFLGPLGKRGSGYPVTSLRAHLREALGLARRWRLCIIGAGQLGRAFLQYAGLSARGFDVVGVYDTAPKKIGASLAGLVVRDMRRLTVDAERDQLDIALLVTPAASAQEALDDVVAAGIRGVLNFASTPLKCPSSVVVHNVDMTTELEAIAFSLYSADGSTNPRPSKSR